MRKPSFAERTLVLAVCCAAGGLGLRSSQAQDRLNGRSMGPMATAEAQRGEQQFQQNCSACHGPAAKGTTRAPNLIASSVVRHDKDGDQIGVVVRQGRPEQGMPAFPNLTSDQVHDVVAYLHARVIVTENRAAATGPAGGYDLKKLLTRDATAGDRYFHGEGGCAGCHTGSADLKGVASRYQPAELQAKFLYPGKDMRTVTVTPASGPAVPANCCTWMRSTLRCWTAAESTGPTRCLLPG